MPRIRPAKFVHVVYRTRRFSEMLQWYATVFDAQVRYQNPAVAFLSYDEEHHRMALVNLDVFAPVPDPEKERAGVIGVDHVAYTYDTLHDLFENYAQLKAQGITPYWTIHHGTTVSMYYADPDGNQMELQVDCFANAQEANDFMDGPGFAQNPIGVEYDPDAWLQRLRSGEPAEHLLERTVHTPMLAPRSATGTWGG